MNKKTILMILVLFIFLVGCSNTADTAEEALVSDAEAELSETATAEPTLEPSATVVVPTATALPPTLTPTATATELPWSIGPDPLQIEVMRQQEYPGSTITFERTLDAGANYNRYLVSYYSDGYKIYAMMTVPFGEKPETGWPVIIFNHGYIHPPYFQTEENYVYYMDMMARNGYIVFKSDYRGHGNSEGEIIGAGYGSPDYTTDVLIAMESLKNYEDADPDRFGMWGHSMGGQVTLRAMVVSDEIKAGVIWSGSVAPYTEIVSSWNIGGDEYASFTSSDASLQGWVQGFGGWAHEFIEEYGTAEQNPDFWDSISPNSYLEYMSGPLQVHHGTADRQVPLSWSEGLLEAMDEANMPYEFYTYEGDNHNISTNYAIAMQRTVDFFDQYLKDN